MVNIRFITDETSWKTANNVDTNYNAEECFYYYKKKYSIQNEGNEFIVATEAGIIHQMQKASPGKVFIPAPPMDSTCGCNDCEFMKLNTLQKIYLSLKYEYPEVHIDEEIRLKALRPIERMLDLSAKLKL